MKGPEEFFCKLSLLSSKRYLLYRTECTCRLTIFDFNIRKKSINDKFKLGSIVVRGLSLNKFRKIFCLQNKKKGGKGGKRKEEREEKERR